MNDFAVLRAPSQVLFGVGMAAATGEIVSGYGRRVLVCTDPTIAATEGFESVRASLAAADLEVALFANAAVDVPRETIEAAAELARSEQPDAIVAVGGGSVIDLAKVTALLIAHGGPLENYYAVNSVPGPVLPLVALPTTAGTGSEATPVSVITDPAKQMKVGVASPYLIPRHAVVDPLLTVDAPATVTAHSGIDALSHAIEAYMSRREAPSVDLVLGRPQVGKNLLSDSLALTAAGWIARSLLRAVEDGADLEARTGMAYGSLLAGMSFGNSGVSAAHALQFAVGAATHTSHGLGTGLLLPYVMEYNRSARVDELAQLASVMDPARDPVEFVHDLGLRIGLPASLAAIGVAEEDLRGLAEASVGIKRLIDNNPRELDVDALESILAAAWYGDPARLATLATA
jgi:alcohol dehydrogenase